MVELEGPARPRGPFHKALNCVIILCMSAVAVLVAIEEVEAMIGFKMPV